MINTKEKELQEVRMLGLKLPTDPRWVNLAEMDLEEQHKFLIESNSFHIQSKKNAVL